MDITANLLMDMGITPELKGFDYIKLAVTFIIADKAKYRNVTKNTLSKYRQSIKLHSCKS